MVAGDDDSRCPRNEPVWQFSFSALDNLSNKARRRFFPKRIPVFQHSVPALDDLIGIHFYFPLLGWHWWRRFALSWGSILFCGGVAPGFPGLYQVNAVVPAGISAGTVPISL